MARFCLQSRFHLRQPPFYSSSALGFGDYVLHYGFGRRVTPPTSPTTQRNNFLRSLTTPFGTDELEFPSRLFETSCEPTDKKMVNNYFNICWIEVIKSALKDKHLAMLSASQFGQVLKMGSHTFSVMFLQYILAQQLVTEKDFKLWWVFMGKPICYAIQDFALVTELNCEQIVDIHHQAKDKGVCGKGTQVNLVYWRFQLHMMNWGLYFPNLGLVFDVKCSIIIPISFVFHVAHEECKYISPLLWHVDLISKKFGLVAYVLEFIFL